MTMSGAAEATVRGCAALVDEALESFFARRTAEVQRCSPFLAELYGTLRSFVGNGGKRLRPTMLIMAYRAVRTAKGAGQRPLEEDAKAVMHAALALELMHNSTLVHDDIMDEDELRRGKPSVWKMLCDYYQKTLTPAQQQQEQTPLFTGAATSFAVSQGILAGNLLLAESLRLLQAEPRCLAKLMEVYTTVNFGQALDIVGVTSGAAYLSMLSQKTGCLFSAAMAIGAMLAGASERQLTLMEQFAQSAALAFQLQDDVMDISPAAQKGHVFGSDIRQHKHTLLVEEALEHAPAAEAEVLRSALAIGPTASEKLVTDAALVINKYGLPGVERFIVDHTERAKRCVTDTENTPLWGHEANFFVGLADVFARRSV
eukprot:TRINITY_DN5207_c0_g1_i1.p1 TRINITY_DN5207_c0_g1~~TRINITY_DN5207_c0_g1_i1.p1  ORF type:complete len:422 (-),score=138.41 TRINITY_DN5207_c0_g1_i1:26-1141(-)